MGKYIIELEDKPFHKEDGDFLYRVKGFNSLVFDMTGIGKLTPYTEPDLEQVRMEAYEDGYKTAKVQCNIQAEKDLREVGERHYKKGLSDAWEAARKIQDAGGNLSWWIHNTTASEAIEKLKAYEQERDAIKVGDEVKGGDEKYIVLQKYLNNIDEPMAVLFNKRDGNIHQWHLYNANGAIFEKTGRHFPEIATILDKMRSNT